MRINSNGQCLTVSPIYFRSANKISRKLLTLSRWIFVFTPRFRKHRKFATIILSYSYQSYTVNRCLFYFWYLCFLPLRIYNTLRPSRWYMCGFNMTTGGKCNTMKKIKINYRVLLLSYLCFSAGVLSTAEGARGKAFAMYSFLGVLRSATGGWGGGRTGTSPTHFIACTNNE